MQGENVWKKVQASARSGLANASVMEARTLPAAGRRAHWNLNHTSTELQVWMHPYVFIDHL